MSNKQFNVPQSSAPGGGGGSGTVTSVTFTGDGTVLSSTPSSAVTTSGTLAAALATAGANTVLGNATGSTAAPAYGQIVNGQITNSTISLTTKVAGVLPPANGGVAVVATSAQGGFYGGLGICTLPFNLSSLTMVASNNQVRYLRFVLPYKATVGRASVFGGASTTGAGDVGVYSSDGTTLLANTGAVAYSVNTPATTVLAQGSVTFNPGVYIFAYTAATSTFQYYGVLSNSLSLTGNSTAQFGIAGNNATAGALPSSLGSLTGSVAITFYPAAFFEP